MDKSRLLGEKASLETRRLYKKKKNPPKHLQMEKNLIKSSNTFVFANSCTFEPDVLHREQSVGTLRAQLNQFNQTRVLAVTVQLRDKHNDIKTAPCWSPEHRALKVQ